MNLDLADAVNVALAARHQTDTLLILDRLDFRALRPLSHLQAFRLLPDDQLLLGPRARVCRGMSMRVIKSGACSVAGDK